MATTTTQEIAAISTTPIFCSICGLTFYGAHFAAPHHVDYIDPAEDDNNDEEGLRQIDEVAEEYHAQIVSRLSWQHEASLLSDVVDEFSTLEMHYKGGRRGGIGRFDGPTGFESDDGDGEEEGSGGGGGVVVREGIRIERAIFTGVDDVFRLDGDDDDDGDDAGQHVKANDIVGRDLSGDDWLGYRIAVHRGCMAVATDFIDFQQRQQQQGGGGGGTARVRNVRALWKVLRMRWDALDQMLMLTKGQVLAPAYGALKGRSVYKYPSFGDDEIQFHERWVEQDPRCEEVLGGQANKAAMLVGAVGLAAGSVSTADGGETKKEAFRQRFYALPQELQDIIADQIVPGDGLALECTGVLGQETWMEILVRGRALPWLGPVDRRVLRQAISRRTADLQKRHLGEERGEITLDWELLVRRLSQPIRTKKRMGLPTAIAGIETVTFASVTECLADFKPAELIPDALRSRKWRWELLEKMFVCDVVPVWTNWMEREREEDPAIPRYWDEYGERVWPVERLMGDSVRDW